MFRLIFMILVIFALFGFAYTNQVETASLHLFWGVETEPVAVYLIVIASFLIGAMFAVLMTFPGWIRLKLERRRQSKRIEQLETELDHVRSEALKSPAPPFPPPATGLEEGQEDSLI